RRSTVLRRAADAGVDRHAAPDALRAPSRPADGLPAAVGRGAVLHLRSHRRHRRALPAPGTGDLSLPVDRRPAGGGAGGRRQPAAAGPGLAQPDRTAVTEFVTA